MGPSRQRGVNVLVIFGFMIVAVVAAYLWRQETREASRLAKEAEQAVLAQAALEAQRAKEREAFEQKVAAEKKKTEYAKSIDALRAIHVRWQDAVRLADSTPRIQLSGQIASLQAIKRDTEALMVPECLALPKANLSSGMAVIIDGFISFMRDADSGKLFAAVRFSEGRRLLTKYEEGLSACGV